MGGLIKTIFPDRHGPKFYIIHYRDILRPNFRLRQILKTSTLPQTEEDPFNSEFEHG
jgi:hypothetical protein